MHHAQNLVIADTARPQVISSNSGTNGESRILAINAERLRVQALGVLAGA